MDAYGPTRDALDAQVPEETAGAPAEVPADDAAMIMAMRSYREAKAELDQRKERAAAYLDQVKRQIEADLAAGEEHLERLRSSMLAFLTGHNGGKKFSVPGLGCATTATRTSVRISDEKRFLASLTPEQRDSLFELKLSNSRARAAAKAAFEEDGEDSEPDARDLEATGDLTFEVLQDLDPETKEE